METKGAMLVLKENFLALVPGELLAEEKFAYAVLFSYKWELNATQPPMVIT